MWKLYEFKSMPIAGYGGYTFPIGSTPKMNYQPSSNYSCLFKNLSRKLLLNKHVNVWRPVISYEARRRKDFYQKNVNHTLTYAI